jgi:segregation and condensation protein B
MEQQHIRQIIESALLAYGQPLSVEKLQTLFVEDLAEESEAASIPEKSEIKQALDDIAQSCEGRGFELKKVSSGWRFQVRTDMARWVNKLWEEKPQRYSRALLETLAIIAYRQPITRSDIEQIRGVAVSSHIIKTLSEREWVKVVGHRDVPGRPSLYATTRQFLDYFNLESLEELPSLRELADIDSLTPELDLQGNNQSSDTDQSSEEENRQHNNAENESDEVTTAPSPEVEQQELAEEGGARQADGSGLGDAAKEVETDNPI